jgi:hypothetical protein
VRGGGVKELTSLDSKKQWEKVFVDCFSRIDAEVGGNAAAGEQPVAPDTVGSTAAVPVVCSSHVIVANYRDSWAVPVKSAHVCVSIFCHRFGLGLAQQPCVDKSISISISIPNYII